MERGEKTVPQLHFHVNCMRAELQGGGWGGFCVLNKRHHRLKFVEEDVYSCNDKYGF
jgi:hypothetical protein